MLFDGVSDKRDESRGLRTSKQIALFRQRQAAKREQAERREAEARVRHLNFDLVQRAVLLILALAIGIVLLIAALSNLDELKFALGGASAWAAIAAALYRWRPKH